MKSIPTIISSNCLGGFIYHDANLKFTSPTINLTFDPIDFLNFCNHINKINDIKFEEINSVNDYPTAKMFFKDGSSSIVYFVHYKKYFDAVDKFMKRASRIGSNICLLFTVNELTDEIVDEFDKLPYKKICFYKINLTTSELDTSIYNLVINNSSGKDLLNFCKPLSRKLVIDYNDIDYYEACGFLKK